MRRDHPLALDPDAMTAAGTQERYAALSDDGDPTSLWWVALIAGAVSIGVGVLALAYPGPTLLAVGLLFGIYLTLWGASMLYRGAAGHGLPAIVRVLFALIGIFGVLAGLMLMVRPGQSVLTVVWVLGFWWVLSGALQLTHGFASSAGRTWNIIWGMVGIVAGVVILAQPGIGLVTLVWIGGIALIAQGTIELFAAFELRRLHRAVPA
jgi:uncharacterized membrane protein HdeD (DUF308 family)